MATPAVKEATDEDADPEPTDSEPDEDSEVEMVQTDVATTGEDPEGFFDGVETDAGNDTADDAMFDGVDAESGGEGGSDGSKGGGEAAETRSSGLASDINAGVARAAVIGLDDEWTTDSGESRKKTDLQTEFEETFAAFRLGHYASICAEEYLLIESDDINPVWGLLGAALICAAVIVYRRPDGDQVIDKAKARVGKGPDLSALKDAVKKETDEDDD